MAGRRWFFAWLGTETEPFDPVAHRRRDIGIKSITGREEEGTDAHVVSIVTTDMTTAQLAGKAWAILSFETPDGTLWPMFRMRREPTPSKDTQGELSLDFKGLPSNWMTRRDTVLATKKVGPFWSALFVLPERQNDPTEILDGYREVGHFDRVTQAYTTVEQLGVGLPVKVLTARNLVGWKNGGGIRRRRTQKPLAGVQVNMSGAWMQVDDGIVDMTPALAAAFPDGSVGDPTGNGPSATKRVPEGVPATCTPDALEGSLPEMGAGIGGASGYSVALRTLLRIPTPAGAAARTGACRGQKARYNFTSDDDLNKPIDLGFDIAFYDASFALAYSLRQKREEHVGFYLANANVAYADGAVETINLKIEDPTVDAATTPYLPNENVAVGDKRRVGIYTWAANRAHVTRGSFAQDLSAADGHEQWDLLPTNGSAAGTSNLATLFGLPLGDALAVCAAYKAIKKVSLSQRAIEYRFVVPLEDWPDVSTAWAVRLNVDDPLVPGGTAFGKVTAVEISQSGTKDFPKASVTVVCCDGKGAVGPDQDHGVNPSGQPWDGITLTSTRGIPVPATPVPGGIIVCENHPEQQITYVQANDWTGQPGRNDRALNDPKHLLGQAKTKLIISCNPISGQPSLSTFTTLVASPWGGPAQTISPEI